jgi:hypothetical protein
MDVRADYNDARTGVNMMKAAARPRALSPPCAGAPARPPCPRGTRAGKRKNGGKWRLL